MIRTYYKRKIYDKLKQWKAESNGKTALLIEGARRVGKSTVVEYFAQNEYQSYILINFSIASRQIKSLFEDISDLNYFFASLQIIYHKDLHERNSLIIFDEVQQCPKAREAIKSLVLDGRYDYIETGSLISIKKNVEGIVIPSEERKISMYPMDYEEFLWALDDHTTMKLLSNFYTLKKPLGEAVNRQLMRQFRLYMLVGGMPQAVQSYLETNNFRQVDQIKRDIINLYQDDFYKIDPTGRLSKIFESIPAQLNKQSKGFQTRNVIKSYRSKNDTLLSLISQISDSKTVNVAYHCDNPDIGLSAGKNLDLYKLYMADTGLFVTLQFKDLDFTDNIIYEKLLSDKLSTNLGYLYENAVAQQIVAAGRPLYYYTFEDQISKKNYEIDFLFAKRNKICPIEVKSSNYRVHKSIDMFYQKYSNRIIERYIIHTKDISKDKDILCLPIYMTSFLFEEPTSKQSN